MPRSTRTYESGVIQGCIYAATKSPGAILDNVIDVGPKGGGQDARRNDKDVREDIGLILISL